MRFGPLRPFRRPPLRFRQRYRGQRRAARKAAENATLNHFLNCRFIAGSAESIFKKIPVEGHESAVIVDPPRKGCDEAFLDQLHAFGPRRIVYVSCAP
ncbi:tRNA (uracil(54)-C(5))-methyltransferase [Verrucomicrobiota bacterium]|nr:tRNA (uracil(54)-C(5))-methyltransferase [Verrucomicrobiota bacterium]